MPHTSNPFPAIFMLAGSALLIAGVAWVWRPGAVMAAGVLLIVWAFMGQSGGSGPETR